MWILQTKALGVRNHEPCFTHDSKAPRGQGTFQRVHSRKEWKGRHDQTVPTFYSLDILPRETWETGMSGHGVCVPRQGQVRKWVWGGQGHASPPAHWHSEMPSSRRQLLPLGAVRKIVKDFRIGKTNYWGFCLAHPSGVWSASYCLWTIFSSVQFSRSVVSDPLRPHESQHTRPPYPTPTPGVHSDSRPSSQWCHPAISSSVVPFSSCPQTLWASVFSNESTILLLGKKKTGTNTNA